MREVDDNDYDGEDKKTDDDNDDDDDDDDDDDGDDDDEEDGSCSWGMSCRIRFTLKEHSKRTVLY